MISISKTFEWDMGHRVPNHESLCKNPHGHRYKMRVIVTGAVKTKNGDPEQGMIIDFGKLKKLVKSLVIDPLDHSFMYYRDDKIMDTFSKNNKTLRLIDVPFVPTAENIVENIAEQISGILKKKIPELILESIELFETPKSVAIWKQDDQHIHSN